jgi:diguanylate cyclase (GGDEF)-like protein
MTFHGRLRLFFAIIVIVPMLAIGLVLFSLTADSERGKADAGLATGLSVAFSRYSEGRAAAADDLRRVARDDALKRALSDRDAAAAQRRLQTLVRADRRIVGATLRNARGKVIARSGSARAMAPFTAFLEANGGNRLGTLAVSVTDARRFVRASARQTRLQYVVLKDGKVVASTVRGVTGLPSDGDFESGGHDYRGRRAAVGGTGGAAEEVGAFQDASELNSNIATSRLLIAIILVAFLLLALATSVFVVRALQGQVGQFLEAARRLAGGRFDQRVPIEGNDEFAQLGREFNNMSEQLAANIRAVEEQRRAVEDQQRELEEAIRRIGKAIATGLDRQGIYDLTVQTAVRACSAEAARAVPLDLRELREARAGSSEPALLAALEEAERKAMAIGPQTAEDLGRVLSGGERRLIGRRPVAIERGGVHALALPLQAQVAGRAFSPQVGVVSIARRQEAFTGREAELFEYLCGQAAVSLENADLHETVQKEAITESLTGLANRRQMLRVLDRELERQKRFEGSLAFVELDIDDFKRVNDTHGHPQGDEVLLAVAHVMRDLTRDTDEPARIGGEEFAVVLPQTDVAGAKLLAERMREAIEQLRIPHLNGGNSVSVTASFGVGAVPASATDKDSLILAADQALYRAKAAGKNRVSCAPDIRAPDR